MLSYSTAAAAKEGVISPSRFTARKQRSPVPLICGHLFSTPEPTYIEIDMRYKRAQQKQISALGGKFDGQRQRWYVPAGQSVKPFAEWLA